MSSSATSNVTPSPLRIFQMFNAFQQTEALRAAIELDLFTALADGPLPAAELAKRTKSSAKGTRVLSDFLVIAGLLNKNGDRYSLTPESEFFLSRRSPAYVGSATQFLATEYQREHFSHLADAVRQGGASRDEDASTTPDNPMWVTFARGMAPLRKPTAEFIATLLDSDKPQPCKVLDIAASHGLFGIAIAKRNPKAQIAAVDWSIVLEVAKENAANAGVLDRYRTIPGSAFDVEFGNDYDVVLLTAFLHHFDIPTNETLLRKIHKALKPGGRVATLEFVPNDDRVTPAPAAAFALTMLSNTPSGDAYTFRELETMFRNAGFSSTKMHNNPAAIDHVLISTK